jgi:hypothetical protein
MLYLGMKTQVLEQVCRITRVDVAAARRFFVSDAGCALWGTVSLVRGKLGRARQF